MKRVWFIVSICMIVAGCWDSIALIMEYRAGQELYSSIEKSYTIPLGNAGKTDECSNDDVDKKESRINKRILEIPIPHAEIPDLLLPEDAPERVLIDWQKLKQVNEELVAWIQIPAIDVSYPVVQGEDNSFYLHRSFEKEELFSGCLFMDAYNDPDFNNFNTIIYGHNMRDGSMFAGLKNYYKQEVWDTFPYFWIYTEQGDYLYQIFSIHEADANGNVFTLRFPDIGTYADWMQKMKNCSVMNANMEVSSEDKVITLSTCTASDQVRQVLQGVLRYKG